MTGARGRTASKGQSGSLSTDDRTKKKGTKDINEELVHMVHNGALRAGVTESEESEGEPGMVEQIARLQKQMDVQIERQVELRVREERARMAQEAVTPRRTGPPAPGTPASLPRKRINDIMRRINDIMY